MKDNKIFQELLKQLSELVKSQSCDPTEKAITQVTDEEDEDYEEDDEDEDDVFDEDEEDEDEEEEEKEEEIPVTKPSSKKGIKMNI